MLLAYLFSRITLHLAQHGDHPPQEYFAKTQHPLRSRPHHLRHCRRPRKPRRGGDKIKRRRPHSLCLLKKTRGKVSYMKEIRNFASHCRRFPDANRLFADNAIDRQHSINNLKKQKTMAYVISDDCIACGTCIDECPSGAISEGEKYSIDPNVCVDCGTCADVCPSGAIAPGA